MWQASGPRDTVKKRAVYRRARACPSPCLDRAGNGVSLRAFFAQIERSRGTGPRATGPEGVFLSMRRSGSGDPELQSPAPILKIVIILKILLQILLISGAREGSRGTGPRATGPEGVLLAIRVMECRDMRFILLKPRLRLHASQILTTSTSPVSNERFAARVTANVFTASA